MLSRPHGVLYGNIAFILVLRPFCLKELRIMSLLTVLAAQHSWPGATAWPWCSVWGTGASVLCSRHFQAS